MNQLDAHFKQVDILPMVKHYMESLNLYELMNKYVPSSHNNHAEHAEGLCFLVANIICDNKPLYKVQEWLAKYSDGIVGDPINSNLFNDDRLGRSLSALYEADRNSLMVELSSQAIKVHELSTNDIHNDTTSVTLIGAYKNNAPDSIQPKLGHNKDFRPDCKQIVFGLNITNDGHVPISFNLYDGNTNDDITHVPNWNGLRELLGKEDFIYIADCKLCSEKNLSHIAHNGGLFITLVPKGRTEVKDFINYREKNELKLEKAFDITSSRSKSEINSYKTFEAKKNSKGFRVIWVHSSGKEKDDKERRGKKLEKAEFALKALVPKLNKYQLKTQKQIKTAVDKICRAADNLIKTRVVMDRKRVDIKVSPYIPGKCKAVYKYEWDIKYGIKWELCNDKINTKAMLDGFFPLITNTNLKASEVLRKYKHQPFLEKRMYTKKSILEVAPVFLKNTRRIEAILFLFFVALMVVSLIERRIRMNMEKENIKKIPILPQKMNTKKPTWNNIRYFFRNVHLAQIFLGNNMKTSTLKGLSDLHQQVNQLLEVPSLCYENLQNDWWSFKGT